jgi:hypothetical protein
MWAVSQYRNQAYHRTETLGLSNGFRFVAKVEIVGIVGHLRDDAQMFETKEDARAREIELADKWKFDHEPPDQPWKIHFRN